MTKLKQKRLEKGLTATEVCRKTGFTNTSLSLWENGKRKIGKLSLYKLAKVLECEPDDLQE